MAAAPSTSKHGSTSMYICLRLQHLDIGVGACTPYWSVEAFSLYGLSVPGSYDDVGQLG